MSGCTWVHLLLGFVLVANTNSLACTLSVVLHLGYFCLSRQRPQVGIANRREHPRLTPSRSTHNPLPPTPLWCLSVKFWISCERMSQEATSGRDQTLFSFWASCCLLTKLHPRSKIHGGKMWFNSKCTRAWSDLCYLTRSHYQPEYLSAPSWSFLLQVAVRENRQDLPRDQFRRRPTVPLRPASQNQPV